VNKAIVAPFLPCRASSASGRQQALR